MTFTAGNFLLLAGLILILSILLSKTGYKAGIPVLLVFLLVGMLFGEDGVGIHFGNYKIAQSIGMVAMSIILFNGGMDTKFTTIKPVLGPGIVLATVGVLLTTLIAGFFIHITSTSFNSLINVSFPYAVLIAATMSSTDSASVFSIIRAQKMKMHNNLQPLLELESGSNDPMANMLTIVMIQIVMNSGGDVGAVSIILTFLWQFGMGLVIGFVFGRSYVWLHNTVKLENKSMYQILIMGFVFLTFSVTNMINANGYLAVYIAGIVVGNAGMVKGTPKIRIFKKEYPLFGNKKIIEKRSINKLLDGLTWLVQIVMFLMLGLLVTPHNMMDMALNAIILGLFVIFIGRPLAVYISLIPFKKIGFKDKAFISWVGLRGAAPIIFATYPVVAGVKDGELIFNVVFFITLISLLVQGTTIPFVANKLKLGEKDDSGPENFGIEIPDELNTIMEQQTVEKETILKDYPLKKGNLIMIVKRGDRYIVPNGKLILKKGDQLLVISESGQEEIMESLDKQQNNVMKLNWNFNINMLETDNTEKS